MTRTNATATPMVFDLTLAIEDADVLCSLLGETIHLSQRDECDDEYTDLLVDIRDNILRGISARGDSESVLLEFQPVEAVCLLLLLNEILSDCPEPRWSDKLDIDSLLGLSPSRLPASPAV